MPGLPVLTPAQVAALLPGATDVAAVACGGQKAVFRANMDRATYALKFACLPDDIDSEAIPFTDVAARATREVEIMRDCALPHVVKLGPIGLTFTEIANQKLLYFSEEFIIGSNLKELLASQGPLSPAEIRKLGAQMAKAIKEIWSLGKIHRDIKPGNIMRRQPSCDYVLLDAGLAFDVVGESLSAGLLVGTMPYFSPEQFNYSNRRVNDFRSDIFSLGVTLYQLGTGVHPFWTPGDTSQSVYTKITTVNPAAPSTIVASIPVSLDRIILRMLKKSPHLRYRKCDQLIADLLQSGGN